MTRTTTTKKIVHVLPSPPPPPSPPHYHSMGQPPPLRSNPQQQQQQGQSQSHQSRHKQQQQPRNFITTTTTTNYVRFWIVVDVFLLLSLLSLTQAQQQQQQPKQQGECPSQMPAGVCQASMTATNNKKNDIQSSTTNSVKSSNTVPVDDNDNEDSTTTTTTTPPVVECQLYMAPSTLGDHTNLGMYTAIPLQQGDVIPYPELVVPLLFREWGKHPTTITTTNTNTNHHPQDSYKNNNNKKKKAIPISGQYDGKLWDRYIWESSVLNMESLNDITTTTGHSKTTSTSGAVFVPGVGCTINSHLDLYNIYSVQDSTWSNLNYHRSKDPGSGAFSPYSNVTTIVSYQYGLQPGTELLARYGEYWIPQLSLLQQQQNDDGKNIQITLSHLVNEAEQFLQKDYFPFVLLFNTKNNKNDNKNDNDKETTTTTITTTTTTEKEDHNMEKDENGVNVNNNEKDGIICENNNNNKVNNNKKENDIVSSSSSSLFKSSSQERFQHWELQEALWNFTIHFPIQYNPAFTNLPIQYNWSTVLEMYQKVIIQQQKQEKQEEQQEEEEDNDNADETKGQQQLLQDDQRDKDIDNDDDEEEGDDDDDDDEEEQSDNNNNQEGIVHAFLRQQQVRSLSWLQEYGYCQDHIQPGDSLIDQAGRGAFATRNLPKNTIVAYAPLIHIGMYGRELFTILYENNYYYDHHHHHNDGHAKTTTDGSTTSSTSSTSYWQMYDLIWNYSFGHENSTVVLTPYGSMVNYINHNSQEPNVKIQWPKKESIAYKPTWLQKHLNIYVIQLIKLVYQWNILLYVI